MEHIPVVNWWKLTQSTDWWNSVYAPVCGLVDNPESVRHSGLPEEDVNNPVYVLVEIDNGTMSPSLQEFFLWLRLMRSVSNDGLAWAGHYCA